MTFTDKKVFITGASRGIGNGIAKAYRDKGAWVIGLRFEIRTLITPKLCLPGAITVDFQKMNQ